MIFIGPALNTGIGNQAIKYVKLFDPNSNYYVFGSKLPECERGLIYMLPISAHIEYLKYVRTRVKNLVCMTICETENVHEDYGLIMKEIKKVVNKKSGNHFSTFNNFTALLISFPSLTHG